MLLWEGLAVGLGEFAARLSLRGYTRSVLSQVGGIDYGFDAHTTTTALVVLAAVAVAALALAAIRLKPSRHRVGAARIAERNPFIRRGARSPWLRGSRRVPAA